MQISHGFTPQPHGLSDPKRSSSLMVSTQDVDRVCEARDLVRSLIEDKGCFSSEFGAMAFGDSCSADCIYEDCFEPEPFVGKKVCSMNFEKLLG